LSVPNRQRQLLDSFDLSVFQSIRKQFAKNAAAWPSRGGRRRELAQLKPGDLVLEVVSGPVPTLGEAVKGPFRVVEVRGNGVVIVATGGTAFKQAELFPRNISSLAKFYDKASVRSSLAQS
jgi:hypothetical protein